MKYLAMEEFVYKFQIGEKVIFDQGPIAEEVNAPRKIEATVYRRADENGYKIYSIKWEPTGRATVVERELTAAS